MSSGSQIAKSQPVNRFQHSVAPAEPFFCRSGSVWRGNCNIQVDMERHTNFFELHVGFAHEGSGKAADDFLAQLIKMDSPDWSRSVVKSVHITKPGCMDPHNVPGTLGWLVSRKIFLSAGSWKSTVNRIVLPACEQALGLLSSRGVSNARLEIEFPFACFSASLIDGRLSRTAWAEDPVSIEADHLGFAYGTPLPEVPKWEIHFVLDLVPGFEDAKRLAVDQVAEFLQPYVLGPHEIKVEQTIEYRSQSMEQEGRTGYRLIATAYYDDELQTQKEAERIFYNTDLCQDALRRGYTVRLIPEHIIACLRPTVISKADDLTESHPTEVTHAR